MFRKTLTAILLLVLTFTASAADSGNFEIVASKPREKADWQWHADLVNLYEGDSTLVNGTNIISGDQIAVDVKSFPSSADGTWQDLFRLEFESTALVKTSVQISLSAFVDNTDTAIAYPVEFQTEHTYTWNPPSGFNTVFTPSDHTENGTADGVRDLVMTEDIIDVAQMQVITGSDGKAGFIRYALAVRGRFTEDIPDEELAGHTWVMPVRVLFTVEGE